MTVVKKELLRSDNKRIEFTKERLESYQVLQRLWDSSGETRGHLLGLSDKFSGRAKRSNSPAALKQELQKSGILRKADQVTFFWVIYNIILNLLIEYFGTFSSRRNGDRALRLYISTDYKLWKRKLLNT